MAVAELLLALLGLLLGPLGAEAATLWRYPYLQNVRRNAAVVMWATVENGTGGVQFSTDKSFSRTVTAKARVFPATTDGYSSAITQYEAELTGLSPDTQYFYRILFNGHDLTPNDELKLRTAPPGPARFTFLAFGDSGLGSLPQQYVATRMSLENPALVLHVGDIAYMEGTYLEFENHYFAYYPFLMKRAPFYPVAGNHEYYTDHAAPLVALHSLPDNGIPADRNRYYSFDWGDVHFVGLDTNEPLAQAAQGLGPMIRWLDDDLAKTKLFWRVVYWHQPPYAYGPNQNDPLEKLARDLIAPLMDKYDVQLVLNGHEHSYQRSYPMRGGKPVAPNTGTLYLVTGGGGGNLYPTPPGPVVAFGASINHYVRVDVNAGKMTIMPIGVDATLIDPAAPIVLQPGPIITPDSVVNAASFAKALAPGSLASIFGRFLALTEAPATALPLPVAMAGTQVLLSGKPLPLLYVSRSQINVQMPFDVTGPATLRVTTANGFSDAAITIAPAAPAIFMAGPNAVIVHQSGGLVTPAAPAKSGEFVTIYMTGLGAVTGTVEAGQASPPLPAKATVRVGIGAAVVVPSFAGLAPGFAGLNQVNVQIPADLAPGNYQLRVAVDGVASDPVRFVVQ